MHDIANRSDKREEQRCTVQCTYWHCTNDLVEQLQCSRGQNRPRMRTLALTTPRNRNIFNTGNWRTADQAVRRADQYRTTDACFSEQCELRSRTLRTVCCQTFLSLRRATGFSRKSIAPKRIPTNFCCWLVFPPVRTKGTVLAVRANADDAAGSLGTTLACMKARSAKKRRSVRAQVAVTMPVTNKGILDYTLEIQSDDPKSTKKHYTVSCHRCGAARCRWTGSSNAHDRWSLGGRTSQMIRSNSSVELSIILLASASLVHSLTANGLIYDVVRAVKGSGRRHGISGAPS